MKIYNIQKAFPENNFTLSIPELHIEPHKIHILIGENGCGKSVLLKEILNHHRAILLMQNPYIFNKTVYKSLEFIQRICKSDVDILSLLERVNLLKERDLQSLSLSGGQKQRLAFAMVLMSNEELILLDEPFNGIDVYSQKIMVDVIKQSTEKTFIIVTHKLQHAKSFGDYFIFMEDGVITEEGDGSKFFANQRVQKFVQYE